jgi:uncharacterized membrane protein (UPF0127 family)
MVKKRKNNFFSGAQPHQAIAGGILVVGVILIALFVPKNYRRQNHAPATVIAPTSSQIVAPVDLTQFRWEIALTDAEHSRGLSGRTSLDPNTGMVFVFERPWYYPFWMKDTNFPLDIVWLNQDRVVDVATLRAVSSSQAWPDSHVPVTKADRVLEVNAGLAKELGLKIGAQVILPEL